MHGGMDNNFSTFEFVASKEAPNITPVTFFYLNDRHIKLHLFARAELFSYKAGSHIDVSGASLSTGVTFFSPIIAFENDCPAG